MGSIVVRPLPPVRGDDGSVRIECRIDAPDLPQQLWFHGAASGPLSRPTGLDWALVALLFPAMQRGLDLRLEGPVSGLLLKFANHEIQSLLVAVDSRLKSIRVHAGAHASPPLRRTERRVATGFSAGVDSFATLLHYGQEPSDFRITDLSFFNVGAFGHRRPHNDPDALFRQGCRRTVAYAEARGYSWVTLDSNLNDFYTGSFGYTHTLRNAAAALFFEERLDWFLYSSAYEITTVKAAAGDINRMDPALLPLLSTERLQLQQAGGFMTRVEKTVRVAAAPDTYTRLDVCVSSSNRRDTRGLLNCTRCWKCARTLFTLECLGALDRYSSVFDLDFYRKNRTRLLNTLTLRAHNPHTASELDMEVIQLMRRAGKRVPWRWQARLGKHY